MSLTEKDRKFVWHPFTQMKTSGDSLAIVSGKCSLIFDEDGRSYIDAIASWWVNLHGHAHPHITKKVHEQMQKLDHIPFAGFTHKPAVELCERLSKVLPSNQAKFFFSGDGSSSVEIALKMSVQYWRNKGESRTRIIALDGGYHGETFGAMSAGARSIFSAHFNDFLFDVDHISFPGDGEKCVADFKSELEKGGVAAFIFEPLVQGAGGMRMYSPEVLDKLISLAHEYGVLCIADEVMTGFGRTGKLFAANHLNEKPDFMCMSKGLSGGTMPLSLTTCTQEIYDAFLGDDITTAFLHGHSFTGNPVGCASALASLDLLESSNCLDSISRISDRHSEFALKVKEHVMVDEVRQMGTIIALDLKDDKSGYASEVRDILYNHFISEGVLLRPLGNVIYILPPYCITDEELEKVYNCVLTGLDRIAI